MTQMCDLLCYFKGFYKTQRFGMVTGAYQSIQLSPLRSGKIPVPSFPVVGVFPKPVDANVYTDLVVIHVGHISILLWILDDLHTVFFCFAEIGEWD